MHFLTCAKERAAIGPVIKTNNLGGWDGTRVFDAYRKDILPVGLVI